MSDTEQDPFVQNNEIPDSTTFGKKRLDYSNPVYRDVCCAVIYYLVLALIIGYGVWITIDQWPQIQKDAQNAIDTTQNDTANIEYPINDYSGIWVALLSCAVIGLFFGFCWLQILKSWASFVVKTMAILSCILWIAVTVIAFAYNEVELGIFFAIMAAIVLLYTFCVWSRIAFAAVLLELGARIVSNYSGVVCVQFTVILLSVAWFGWVMFLLFVIGEYKPNGWEWIFFGLILSLYWSFEVNGAISHTTVCGVAAVWYFTPSHSRVSSPTCPSFNRAMTTSFGSICLGALIVAVLEFIRAIVGAALRNSNNCCACLVMCCLACIEACVRWFNAYAYAHCAIYGVSFMKAAAQTWQLLSKEGIKAIINDDLSGLGVMAGNLCACLGCGGIGYGIAYAYYGGNSDPRVSQDLVLVLAIGGAIIGGMLCWMTLKVVRSAIVTLFVLFAEEPSVLYNNRRGEFNKIVKVNSRFEEIVNNAPSQSV